MNAFIAKARVRSRSKYIPAFAGMASLFYQPRLSETLNDRKQNEEPKKNLRILSNKHFYFQKRHLIYKRNMICSFSLHFVYPLGRPMSPHLLRYPAMAGLAIADPAFSGTSPLGALKLGQPRFSIN
jgi:hypothetical protein